MKDRAKAQRERKKKQRLEPQTATFVCESAAVADADDARLAAYSSSHRILLVGEGDLSFAAALAVLEGGANITASTLDTADELEAKYPAVQERLAALRAAGATIALLRAARRHVGAGGHVLVLEELQARGRDRD